MRYLAPIISLGGVASAMSSVYPGELGYWDLNMTYITDASAYEAQYVTAVHSMTPAKTLYDSWTYDPRSGNFTAQRNSRSFKVEIDGGCGVGFLGMLG
jgi:hypothetical protein